MNWNSLISSNKSKSLQLEQCNQETRSRAITWKGDSDPNMLQWPHGAEAGLQSQMLAPVVLIGPSALDLILSTSPVIFWYFPTFSSAAPLGCWLGHLQDLCVYCVLPSTMAVISLQRNHVKLFCDPFQWEARFTDLSLQKIVPLGYLLPTKRKPNPAFQQPKAGA